MRQHINTAAVLHGNVHSWRLCRDGLGKWVGGRENGLAACQNKRGEVGT